MVAVCCLVGNYSRTMLGVATDGLEFLGIGSYLGTGMH